MQSWQSNFVSQYCKYIFYNACDQIRNIHSHFATSVKETFEDNKSQVIALHILHP